jgi:hypothetical protein
MLRKAATENVYYQCPNIVIEEIDPTSEEFNVSEVIELGFFQDRRSWVDGKSNADSIL